MAVDDSFKKPGAVPFKWEIRPGVPKVVAQQHHKEQSVQPQAQQLQQKQRQTQHKPKQPPPPLPPPASPFINQRSLPTPPGASPKQKLKVPPPPGSYLFLTPEPRTHSFRSTPRARSDRWRLGLDQPARLRPECVSPGCFPSPLLRRKGSKRKTQKSEPDYLSDLETVSRWSVSSRRSASPLYSSPVSSFSSFRFSPRPVADNEWAGFGLF